ncbi:MAG: hypothetical protein ACAH80_11965 [Alphaproteobacteria bacterium]
MALFAKKEAPASDKISQNIDRLEEGIKNDIAWRDEMGAWSKRFGFAALGFVVLLVVAKAPILLAGAVISGVGFGVAKLVQNSYENSLNRKYETQANLVVAQNLAQKGGPGASNAPSEGLSKAFSAGAELSQLQKEVKDLKEQIDVKPVVLDKPVHRNPAP